MKSKYIKSPTEFYTMSNTELRQYVRNASKVLTKRISRLKESPFSTFSETLDRWENEQVFLRGRGFSTKNVTQAELIDTAQVINSVLSVDESPAELQKIVDRDILEEFARGGISSSVDFETFFQSEQLETAAKWGKRYWNMYAFLLKSKEIEGLAITYGDESQLFYTEALKLASSRAPQVDYTEFENWWTKYNKSTKWKWKEWKPVSYD